MLTFTSQPEKITFTLQAGANSELKSSDELELAEVKNPSDVF